MRHFLLTVLLCSIALPAVAAETAASHPPAAVSGAMAHSASRFEVLFRQHVAENRIPGAAFALVQRDGVIGLGTAGVTDKASNRPVDQNTVFRLASVSKSFAAELTALLEQEGHISWSDPVRRYVPGFRLQRGADGIRIEHLLSQSTGILAYAFDHMLDEGVPLQRIQNRYRELAPICQPGSCYSYQNSVYSLIEPVIEQATDRSFDVLMQEKIFQPLEMKTASMGYQAFVAQDNRARPHVRQRGTKNRWKEVEVLPNYYQVGPAAGVNASILDLSKWLMAQLGSRPEVITPAIVEAVTQPRVRTQRDLRRRHWRDRLDNAHYGLGWRIYDLGGEEIVYHGGWVSGYRADVAFSASRNVGIALLFNAESGSISELTTGFWDMVLAGTAP